MPSTFEYKARDPLGNLMDGTIDANSREEAEQRLMRDGFEVVSLDDNADLALDLFSKGVKKNDIIFVTSQLAIMADTGINLSTALEGICSQEENPTLKNALLAIKSSVESGEDFSTALSKYPKYFDKTYVSLVRASEQTGSLGQMLDRIANYMRQDLESGGQVKAALAYPMIMMMIAVAVTIFLLTYIMPQFEPLFAERASTLPATTKIMMVMSNSMINYWYLWIAATAAVVVGFFMFQKTELGRRFVDKVKISLPVVGPMMRKVVLSRSIRTLGTMVQSGVPVLDSLKLSAEVAGNYYYERIWLHVLEQVTAGKQICDGLANNDLFPSTLVQMISSGEETGKLDEVLVKVSNYYDRDVESSLKSVTSMIEPIMICSMGVIIGTIALSLLLPIFQLSRPA